MLLFLPLCHISITFARFAVKQIDHLHDLLLGSTYTQLKKMRALLELGQCITGVRLTRTGFLAHLLLLADSDLERAV